MKSDTGQIFLCFFSVVITNFLFVKRKDSNFKNMTREKISLDFYEILRLNDNEEVAYYQRKIKCLRDGNVLYFFMC